MIRIAFVLVMDVYFEYFGKNGHATSRISVFTFWMLCLSDQTSQPTRSGVDSMLLPKSTGKENTSNCRNLFLHLHMANRGHWKSTQNTSWPLHHELFPNKKYIQFCISYHPCIFIQLQTWYCSNWNVATNTEWLIIQSILLTFLLYSFGVIPLWIGKFFESI